MEQLGDGGAGLLRRVVVGARAAHPEQVVNLGGVLDVLADDGDVEVQLLRPLHALAGGLVVGVRLGFHAAERAAQLAGERALHEDLVATQVEDVVDVLDVDGALLDACTAVRAVPQDLFGDDLGDQGSGHRGDALGPGYARQGQGGHQVEGVRRGRHALVEEDFAVAQLLVALLLLDDLHVEADSMWSRRPMMSSLGERGFCVFHAGHSSWQRPHSVHEYRSRRAFHEKSSIVPTPRTVSSGRSSKSSSLVTGFPSISMWSAGPRDFVPSALRRVYRLRIATKRCQATPMPVWMPTTVSQVMEVMTLRALTSTIAFAREAAEEEAAAAKSAPSQPVRGKCRAEAWASRPGVTLNSAYSRPREGHDAARTR